MYNLCCRMRLEEAIKQTKFESEYMKLFLNLVYTANYISDFHHKTLKEYGLTAQQYNVLRILRGQFPKAVSVGSVSCRMLDKSSNVTRLVDKLLERHLVTRDENPENRRVQLLCITSQGLQLLTTIDPEIRKLNHMLEVISEDEAVQMNNLLDRLKTPASV